MAIITAIIATTTVLSILFFCIYIGGLVRLPTGYRPKTPTLNRLGQPLAPSENPGYRETEEETH